MLLVFALTLFTSATLLFVVEPMVGKMILPQLGVTPAVWNTCMVFYQAVLLAGYAYAHALTSRLGPRTQVAPHLRLGQQSLWWACGYGLLAALVAACGLSLWRSGPRQDPQREGPAAAARG